MKRPVWIITLLVLLATSLALGSWSYRATQASKTYTASYVGRSSCNACHAQQVHSWTGSHHDLAMDPATEETVVDLQAFDHQEFTHQGVTSKFFRKDGKFYVTTDDADGKLATFEIKYVFGVDPLQQYMVEFPDKKKVRTPQGEEIELPSGRVQVLSIAWDTHRGRWFHLYPKQKIPAGDWLHWTGGGQNWNYMCAECHSTDLQKKFDVAANEYHTTFAEIDVSCEACHGPAGEHVARAEGALGFNDPRHFHSYALNKLKGPDSLAEIETCAQCHARRRIVHGDYRPGNRFRDFYEPEILDGTEYFADGQIKEELYEYGSFLQSRMFREGVRCSNCHDPHSLQPKFAGNALCTQCHTLAKYDTPNHHHHPPESKGARCVECHMPERTYMEVDPRRDHSIRVPRPDLTLKLGTPNACQSCHTKPTENVEWQLAKVREWYGTKREQKPHFGEILERGRKQDPHAAEALIDLARNRPTGTPDERAAAVGPVVRASAVALLTHYPSEETRKALERALQDDDSLVRVAAVRAVDQWPDDLLATYQLPLVAALADPDRTVRTEAARALTRMPPHKQNNPDGFAAFERAFAEWVEGQKAVDDQPGTHTAYGTAYANLLKATEDMKYLAPAEAGFRQALKMEPAHLPTIRNYAALLDLVNRDAEAETQLRRALAMVPKIEEPEEAKKRFTAETEYELGWLLFRDKSGTRIAEAAQHLKAAIDGGVEVPEARLYYGLSLLGLNRFSEATTEFTAFCKQTPAGVQTMLQYADRSLRTEQPDAARVFLNVVLAVDPEARNRYPQLAEMLRRAGL